MIFSCTKKVLSQLGKVKEVENRKEELGFYNWYVDLMVLDRRRYFLFTHSESLFSFFIYAGTKKQLKSIELLFEMQLQEMITREIGSNRNYLKAAFAGNDEYSFVKTNSRKVLGSMTDYKRQIEIQLWHKGPLSETHDMIHHLINQCPMSSLAYANAQSTMKRLLEQQMG